MSHAVVFSFVLNKEAGFLSCFCFAFMKTLYTRKILTSTTNYHNKIIVHFGDMIYCNEVEKIKYCRLQREEKLQEWLRQSWVENPEPRACCDTNLHQSVAQRCIFLCRPAARMFARACVQQCGQREKKNTYTHI